MKLAEIFALVLIASMCASSNGNKREKRTLGSILQFFGLKLVPLQENVNKLPEPEKFKLFQEQYAAHESQTQRTPRLNRIQTVMPFVEFGENISNENAESVTMTEVTDQTSEALPTTTESSFMIMTSGQVSDEPEMTNDGSPLRIVLEDSPSTEPSPSAEVSGDSAQEEPTTEINELDTSTPAFTEETSNTQKADIQEETSTETSVETASENPSQNPSEVRFDFPTEVPQFRPLPNYIDQNQLNNNFDFYRSNDVSNRFFNQQDFARTFGVHPQQLSPPRTFTRPAFIQHPFYQHQPRFDNPQYLQPNIYYPQYQQQNQRANSRQSSSSMNINGKEHFNYLTYH